MTSLVDSIPYVGVASLKLALADSAAKHRMGLALILSFVLASGCTQSVGSATQREGFAEISRKMVAIQRERSESTSVNRGTGFLAVFDTNRSPVDVVKVVDGDTAEAAMFEIMQEGLESPCDTNGPRGRIVSFAPPPNVDLPLQFERCTVILSRVS